MPTIAYFVSPHGFGHAARACAVMEAMGAVHPDLHFHIYTTVPEWFFFDALTTRPTYHSVLTDIGLVQTDPLTADLDATLRALDRLFPPDDALIDRLARQLERHGCSLVIADISPVGILVAERAGIPAVLIENFTWDWLYQPHTKDYPRFARHINYLEAVYARVDHHIQTDPVCDPRDGTRTVPPIARAARKKKAVIKSELGIAGERALVLITMGGIQGELTGLAPLATAADCCFVVPGMSESLSRHGNRVDLPQRSRFFHPDLVAAADVVIGKAGYSTIAEVYASGVPFGFIARPDSRESHRLEAYIKNRLPGRKIAASTFASGAWINDLERLLSTAPGKPGRNGARQAADHILTRVLGYAINRAVHPRGRITDDDG